MWKKKILPYFQYTKKERAGILVLLMIVLLLWIIPVFFSDDSSPLSHAEITIIEDSISENSAYQPAGEPANKPDEKYSDHSYSGAVNDIKPFPFDPNTASTSEWQRLGITGKTASVIRNYLEKGGCFKSPDDLQKIYSLRKADFLRLRPYIRINNFHKEQYSHAEYPNSKNKYSSAESSSTQVRETPARLDVNSADIASWEKLNGIGEKLAARIVLFREKLGGFHSVDQVGETFGISPELFETLKPKLSVSESYTVNKIELNTASAEILRLHPYIGRKLASLIISYRDEHGPFSSSSDLQRIPLITKEVLVKIEPYLTL